MTIIKQVVFILLSFGFLNYCFWPNLRLYRLHHQGKIQDYMQNAADQLSDVSGQLPVEAVKKMKLIIYIIAEGISYLIILGIWYCSLAFNNGFLVHLAITYLLLSIVASIFDYVVWPTPFRPQIQLTNLNYGISVTLDFVKYAILAIMTIDGILLFFN